MVDAPLGTSVADADAAAALGATAGAVGTAEDFDGSSSQPTTNEIASRTGIARFIFAPGIVGVADIDIGKASTRGV